MGGADPSRPAEPDRRRHRPLVHGGLHRRGGATRGDASREVVPYRYGPCSGCRLPAAPSTTIGSFSLYAGALATCALVRSRVMASPLLAIFPKCSAFQSTTIFLLPTPRKPPKSITAARTLPVRSTITSTIWPMSSSFGLRTSRPSTPYASLGPRMVTEGGGEGFAGAAVAGGFVAGGDALGGDAVGFFSSAARDGPPKTIRANASRIIDSFPNMGPPPDR